MLHCSICENHVRWWGSLSHWCCIYIHIYIWSCWYVYLWDVRFSFINGTTAATGVSQSVWISHHFSAIGTEQSLNSTKITHHHWCDFIQKMLSLSNLFLNSDMDLGRIRMAIWHQNFFSGGNWPSCWETHGKSTTIAAVFCVVFACCASRIGKDAKPCCRAQGIIVHDKRLRFRPMEHFLARFDVNVADYCTRYVCDDFPFPKSTCSKQTTTTNAPAHLQLAHPVLSIQQQSARAFSCLQHVWRSRQHEWIQPSQMDEETVNWCHVVPISESLAVILVVNENIRWKSDPNPKRTQVVEASRVPPRPTSVDMFKIMKVFYDRGQNCCIDPTPITYHTSVTYQ